MRYILPLLGCYLMFKLFRVVSKFIVYRNHKIREESDYEYTKKHKDCFNGKNKPNNNLSIDYRGKLIEMDEHWGGNITEDKTNL